MIEELLAEAVTRLEWVLIVLATIIIVGPLLAARVRLPGLIGLVLGGLLVGPFGLGLLGEGSLDAIGGIGLLFLMFVAGVELDMNLFQRYRNAALLFGVVTFFLPFTFSMAGGFWIGLSVSGAILMGSVWASHTLVAYPEARQAGLASNKAAAVTVGATVITDTLALLVLAVVSAVAGAESGGEVNPGLILVRLLIGLGLLALYCLWVLPRLGRWFFSGPGQGRVLRFVFIIAALSSAGFLAALVGIEGLVGAFFAGLGLNRLVPNGGRLMEEVEFFSSSLFVPAFLVSVGMLIDPTVLFNLTTIGIAAVFFIALGLGKGLAAWIAGRRFDLSAGEIGLMFSLTVAQAAATLASTMVGLSIGLFGVQVVNAVLLVVMVSLLLTSLGVRRASRLIEPEEVSIKPVGSSILIPVAPSPNLDRLMQIAAYIAFADAGILAPLVVVLESEGEAGRVEGKELLESAEAFGAAAAADVEGAMRIDAAVPQGVLNELAAKQASLILVEWGAGEKMFQAHTGGKVDFIGENSAAPMAGVHFAAAPVQRIVLVPGVDRGDTAYREDLQVALDIAARLHMAGRLPLHALALEGAPLDQLQFPEGAEVTRVARGTAGSALQAGDLLVVPAAMVRRELGVDGETLREKMAEDVSVLVAGGPYRLKLSAARFG